MKKVLCLMMAAVLAVVMMAPIEAGAVGSNDLKLYVRTGTPEITGSVTSWGTDDLTWPAVSYEVVSPITVEFSNMTSDRYFGGSFSIKTNLSFQAMSASNYYYAQIKDISFNREDIYGQFYTNKDGTHQGSMDDGSTVSINDTLGIYFDPTIYSRSTNFRFIAYVTYSIYLISDHAGTTLPIINNLSSSVDYTGYGVNFSFYEYPPEKNWLMGRIDRLSNEILSAMGTFQTAVENKFTTLFTFGRQWTDDIVDAIVGQSGGGSIGTAQDELDNQLNSIENVEQQLSDQVLEKVEVPSISLSSDESGGLNWVVSTINSFYVAFDELHVMFACVVFFSICAVLLFGRRNL